MFRSNTSTLYCYTRLYLLNVGRNVVLIESICVLSTCFSSSGTKLIEETMG